MLVSSVSISNSTGPTSDIVLLDGETANVVCVTSPTRPAPQIQWLLGTTPLTDVNNVIHNAAGALETITSTVTIAVRREFHERYVHCKAAVDSQDFVSESGKVDVWRE